MHTYVVEIIVDFLELILFFVGVYYVVIGVFSLFDRAPKSENIKQNRFAIIIPAHNEANVLGQLILSINNSDYDNHFFDIFVVCDNCSDNTKYVSESFGAYAIEKLNANSNKSAAVLYGVHYIKSLNKDYDAAIILDADNIVGKQFLSEMNKMLCCGYPVIQGRVECKNASENWLTCAYSVWHTLETRFGKIASHNLGLGSKISGTGYTVSFDILDKYPPCDDCLAEDLEYTMRLMSDEIKVAFANDAIVYDEKPNNFRHSIWQRVRWTQGIVDVQGRYGAKLLKKGKFIAWLSLYGDFLGLFSYVIFLLISIFSTVSIIYDRKFLLCGMWANPICYFSMNIYLGIGALTAFIGLLKEKKINRRFLSGLFGFLIYMLSWVPVSILGMLKYNKKEWYHTKHTGSVMKE